MSRKFWQVLLIGCVCLGAFIAGWWLRGRAVPPDEVMLTRAYDSIVADSIFSKLSPRQLSQAAIRGMIAQIDDPYAEWIEPDAARNFQSAFTGQTGVVGLYAENKAGQVVISIVFPGGSAHQAGLQVGDVILSINGRVLDKDADSSETGLLLRGPIGTQAHLKVARGQEVQTYDLTRQEQQFVHFRLLPEGLGYISMSAYNSTASRQMKQAIEDLAAQKPAGLIWDLRNNEGGDMQAAQEILSYFIPKGRLFTAQLTRNRVVEFNAKGNALLTDLPLVVLIDKTTYSAAETSAAAIAETGRGKTVGSKSYGKGVIQATMPMPQGAMLQMTIAKWLSPQGNWYQGRGVMPLVEAQDDPTTPADETLQKAIELLLASR